MKKFTEEQIKNIIESYINSKDIEKIMLDFKCCEREIRLLLKYRNIDRRYGMFSDELKERIIYLYKINDKKLKEVSYDLAISESSVRKHIDAAGIPRKGSSIGNRRYSRNSHYFDNIDTPNKAYILGLLYADGCNHYEGIRPYIVTICLQDRDKHILESIKKELEYDGPIRFVPLHEKNANHKNQYVLAINDPYMSLKLKELGVVQAKSLKLTFPDFLSQDLLRHFCRGYFDGDGNIYYYYKNNKCATQTVGTLDFCNHISDILNSMNIKNNIKHPKKCGDNTFVIQTSGNKSSYNFLSWMYQDAYLKLNRKYNQYLDFCKLYNKSHIES